MPRLKLRSVEQALAKRPSAPRSPELPWRLMGVRRERSHMLSFDRDEPRVRAASLMKWCKRLMVFSAEALLALALSPSLRTKLSWVRVVRSSRFE